MNLPKPLPTTPDFSARFVLFSRVAALVAALGCAAVLVGWWLNIAALKSVLPNMVSMKPNTALCFMLLGSVLWLLNGRNISTRRQWWLRGLASLVVLTTGLTLLQYLLSSDWGIDQWLFLDDTRATKTSQPGRMSPVTAIALGMLALATLCMITRPAITRKLATGALLIGALGINGYLFGVESMYDAAAFTSLAVHTAILLVLLSLGVLVARPTHSANDLILRATLGGASARALTLTIPLALGGLSVLIWLGLQWQWFDPRFGLAVGVVLGMVLSVLIGQRVARELYTADTAKGRVQAELVDLNQRLEQTVAERTASLQQLNANLQAEILERELAQRVLSDSESRLTGVLESAMDAIVSVNSAHQIVLFNSAAEKMFGRAADDMKGQPLDRLIPAQFRAEHSQHISHFGKTVNTSRAMGALGQLIALRANGEEFPIEASISQVDVGNQKLFTVIVRDITERKATAAALSASEASLAAAQQRAKIGSWELKLADKTGYWSAQMFRLFARDPALGIMTLEQFIAMIHPRDREFIGRDLAQTIAERRALHQDFRVVLPDGSVRWIETRGELTYDEARQPASLIGTSQDITARKLAEDSLIVAKEKTETVNIELARSNADLEQFAYAASHDLQEPLRSVASCVQLLQKRYKGQLDARADTFIAHAVSGATRMQALIDDLLAFSRIGSKSNQATDISMQSALAAAIANLEMAIADSNAQITHDPLPNINAQGILITQLLQNLIANAIKFRGDTPAVVHVGARQQGDEWVLSVADQGIGIEPKYFKRIFELFKRLHTREEYAGTGIGLALCKKIVEHHGGRIWVESEPGRGTTFFFALPRRLKQHLATNFDGGRNHGV